MLQKDLPSLLRAGCTGHHLARKMQIRERCGKLRELPPKIYMIILGYGMQVMHFFKQPLLEGTGIRMPMQAAHADSVTELPNPSHI